MSVLKVGALRSPSASSNNIVLNSDGTISSGDGGAIPSNNFITGTFTSNNYVQSQLSGYRTGEIIEHIESVCDGSTVNGVTFPTVTTTQSLTDHLNYVDITGSEITYTPPAGTDRVIYSFMYGVDSIDIDYISRLRLQLNVDSAGYTNIQYAKWTSADSNARERIDTFSWPVVVNTGVSDDYSNAKFNAATPTIQFKVQGKINYTSNRTSFHQAGNGFYIPRIRIQAIAA